MELEGPAGDWTHIQREYPGVLEVAAAAYPTFPDVVAQQPIQLETCGVMSSWEELGWTTDAPDGEVPGGEGVLSGGGLRQHQLLNRA